MNFDTDQWPELLTEKINDYLDLILFGWLFIAMISVFSIILTIFKVQFFENTFAKHFPFAAGILDTMIWAMRSVFFGILALLTLYYMWGDEDYVMFIMIPQLMLFACIIFLLTEILRIGMYGAGKVPK